MSKLTTHVLDTANGRPGAGIALELFRLEGHRRVSLGQFTTNGDGRCDAPLLQGADFTRGTCWVVSFTAAWLAFMNPRSSSGFCRQMLQRDS